MERRNEPGPDPGGMTVKQAGQKGGEKVKEERGPEFYAEIGHKGGQKVKEDRGPEFFSEIGHKGGQKVKDLVEKGKEQEEEK